MNDCVVDGGNGWLEYYCGLEESTPDKQTMFLLSCAERSKK